MEGHEEADFAHAPCRPGVLTKKETSGVGHQDGEGLGTWEPRVLSPGPSALGRVQILESCLRVKEGTKLYVPRAGQVRGKQASALSEEVVSSFSVKALCSLGMASLQGDLGADASPGGLQIRFAVDEESTESTLAQALWSKGQTEASGSSPASATLPVTLYTLVPSLNTWIMAIGHAC